MTIKTTFKTQSVRGDCYDIDEKVATAVTDRLMEGFEISCVTMTSYGHDGHNILALLIFEKEEYIEQTT